MALKGSGVRLDSEHIRYNSPGYKLAASHLDGIDRRLILGLCEDAIERGATGEQLAPFYAAVYMDYDWVPSVDEKNRMYQLARKHGWLK